MQSQTVADGTMTHVRQQSTQAAVIALNNRTPQGKTKQRQHHHTLLALLFALLLLLLLALNPVPDTV